MPRAKKPPPTQEEMLAQADLIIDDLVRECEKAIVRMKEQDKALAKGGKLMKELLRKLDAQTDEVHRLHGLILTLSRTIAEEERREKGDEASFKFVMSKIEKNEKLLKRALANEAKSRGIHRQRWNNNRGPSDGEDWQARERADAGPG
jgi:hypothetical protein